MKKVLIGLLLVVALLLAVVYFSAPVSPISQNVLINAHPEAIYRCLTDQKLVQEWWPEKDGAPVVVTSKSNAATTAVTITPQPFNVVEVQLPANGNPVQSFIAMATLPGDSVEVTWTADIASNSLLARLQNAWRGPALKRDMHAVLQQLQQFMQSDKNIYGVAMQQAQVTDTLLAVTKKFDTLLPSVAVYYNMIKTLRNYIARVGAQETNYPMLNISKVDSVHYQTMVAIPVNKEVPANSTVLAKRMIPGAILVAEVRGGPAAINEGFRQLGLYASDHHLTQPAIPFQSLVTDRSAERDSSKWITKLYYPVKD